MFDLILVQIVLNEITYIIINKNNMITRTIFQMSSLYAPVRGRILSGKWEKVIQQQHYHNQHWKSSTVF